MRPSGLRSFYPRLLNCKRKAADVIHYEFNSLRTPALWILMLAAFVSAVPAAHAQVDTFEFQTVEQQQRFRQLSDELRCPCVKTRTSQGPAVGLPRI